MSACFDPLCPDVALCKSEIVEDLLSCVAEALRASDCDFNDAGAWRSYAALVKVELTLSDIDQSRIERKVQIGNLPKPAIKTVVETTGDPAVVRQRIAVPEPSLELGAPPQKRRWYTPRQAQRKVV